MYNMRWCDHKQISKCNKCKWNWNVRYWNSMLCHHGTKALNSELTLYLEQCKIEIDAYVLYEFSKTM